MKTDVYVCADPEAEWIADRQRDDILAKVIADYDRRMAHWWGRFLLWLLRKTT